MTSIVRPIHDLTLVRGWWRRGRPAPPPQATKLATLLHWADRIDADTFVETGSFLGDTVRHMQHRFPKIYSIEIAAGLAAPLLREFRHNPGIKIIVGDSAVELPKVVADIESPAVFWLDAHHSGGSTEGFGVVPIFGEISAISQGMKASHAIVVDDMVDFNGKDGYPTVDQLFSYFNDHGYATVNFNNMMQAVRS